VQQARLINAVECKAEVRFACNRRANERAIKSDVAIDRGPLTMDSTSWGSNVRLCESALIVSATMLWRKLAKREFDELWLIIHVKHEWLCVNSTMLYGWRVLSVNVRKEFANCALNWQNNVFKLFKDRLIADPIISIIVYSRVLPELQSSTYTHM